MEMDRRVSWKESIEKFAEQAGISQSLTQRIVLLTGLIEKLILDKNYESIYRLASELPEQAARVIGEPDNADAAEPIRQTVSNLAEDEIVHLLRLYTIFFHLVNSLEQHEIIRINRNRAIQSSPENPRTESIGDVVRHFHNRGYSFEQAAGLFARLDIQPTITAHPTEARRRSILNKQDQITGAIARLDQAGLTPDEKESLLHHVINQLILLISTDEVRAERLTVEDEVENGLFYFTHSIWDTIPRIYDDIRNAFDTYYSRIPSQPVILKYRSWIGSDRDGNPNVTADVTWNTLLEQRKTALELYLKELDELRRDLSVSRKLIEIPEKLLESLKKDEKEAPVSDRFRRRYKNEPFRRKITHMMQRLRKLLADLNEPDKLPTGSDDLWRIDHFIADLELIRDCLIECNLEDVAEFGRFHNLLIRARTFGFHLAALDIRQHSELHEECVGELLKLAGVEGHYPGLPEEEKVAILTSELKNPRPLIPVRAELSSGAERVMSVFHLLNRMMELDSQCFGNYIISMTHGVSDLLEVLLLAKESGLWSYRDGEVESRIDVVPLFETIDDLDRSAGVMNEIFDNTLYHLQLEARGRFQEIMLGYSDSNKDGGYWMANWALHKAQQELGHTLRNYKVDFRLFHGRGGTVGRGGGRSNRAILGLPPVSNNGRIRFTEQGEILSFRYSLPDITRRHLEQVVSAVARVTAAGEEEVIDNTVARDITATHENDHASELESADSSDAAAGRSRSGEQAASDFHNTMERLAVRSMEAYRKLIDHPDFWDWYRTVTPVEQIGNLPIASRPVSRGGDGGLQFENLRAIPWVFAWTQVRYNIPGWYGVGTALSGELAAGGKLESGNKLEAGKKRETEEKIEAGTKREIEEKIEADKTLQKFRHWYEEKIFFRTILDNAQREMARTHLPTSRLYIGQDSVGDPFHRLLINEFGKTREAVLQITGQKELLDNRKVIKDSIHFRNHFTYPLNVIQADLLKRWSQAPSEQEKKMLRDLIFLSINSVAAAMQSTG